MEHEELQTSAPLPEELRKELFRALVDIQDQGMSVADSRLQMAVQFLTGIDEVRTIEQEGIEKQWPPLSAHDG